MSITHDVITRITHLARLSNENSGNTQAIQGDLSRIVRMVDQITSCNTEGILPMAHPLDMQQHLRPDVVTEKNERDTLIKLAPVAEEGLYLVPTVIE